MAAGGLIAVDNVLRQADAQLMAFRG